MSVILSFEEWVCLVPGPLVCGWVHRVPGPFCGVGTHAWYTPRRYTPWKVHPPRKVCVPSRGCTFWGCTRHVYPPHRGDLGPGVPTHLEGTPPGRYTPRKAQPLVLTSSGTTKVCGTHTTGIHSCSKIFFATTCAQNETILEKPK